MYKLQLADGSIIEHLTQIKPCVFTTDVTDASLYWKLSSQNLSFATLIDEEDDLLGEVLIDYTLKNFYNNGQAVEFAVCPLAEKKEGRRGR